MFYFGIPSFDPVTGEKNCADSFSFGRSASSSQFIVNEKVRGLIICCWLCHSNTFSLPFFSANFSAVVKGVSRIHFVIWREVINGNFVKWHLADRSSTFGTCVNGVRVRDVELKSGDEIVIAGAFAGNSNVGCEIGEEWSSKHLSNRYFFTFNISYTFGKSPLKPLINNLD